MSRPAVRELARRSDQFSRVLELGSGASTLWFASMGKTVTSLEDDPDWAAWVRSKIDSGQSSCSVLTGDIEVLWDSTSEELASFDLVVVDHNESAGFTRIDVLKRLVAYPGYVCLDNSDRSRYSAAESIMKNHRPIRSKGMLRSPFQASETTLFVPSLNA
jgi:predicted O-methyltransferase YrrM